MNHASVRGVTMNLEGGASTSAPDVGDSVGTVEDERTDEGPLDRLKHRLHAREVCPPFVAARPGPLRSDVRLVGFIHVGTVHRPARVAHSFV